MRGKRFLKETILLVVGLIYGYFKKLLSHISLKSEDLFKSYLAEWKAFSHTLVDDPKSTCRKFLSALFLESVLIRSVKLAHSPSYKSANDLNSDIRYCIVSTHQLKLYKFRSQILRALTFL